MSAGSASQDHHLKTIVIGLLITVVGAVIAAYLLQDARFDPAREIASPVAATIAPTAPPIILVVPPTIDLTTGCRPVLWVEDFSDASAVNTYGLGSDSSNRIVVERQRAHIYVNNAETGLAFPLFGQYEAFILEFKVYPVGEIYDGSVNILFLKHGSGWYELQIRLRRQQIQFLKYEVNELGESRVISGVGWSNRSGIDLGDVATLMRLEVKGGQFNLFVNGNQVFEYSDPEPYLRGQIELGSGAGAVAPITIAIDDVLICAR
jgi:hypothetical protein